MEGGLPLGWRVPFSLPLLVSARLPSPPPALSTPWNQPRRLSSLLTPSLISANTLPQLLIQRVLGGMRGEVGRRDLPPSVYEGERPSPVSHPPHPTFPLPPFTLISASPSPPLPRPFLITSTSPFPTSLHPRGGGGGCRGGVKRRGEMGIQKVGRKGER